MHLRFLFALISFLFLESAPPGTNPPDPPADPKPDDVTFDAKQQDKINALLAAERKSTEEKVAARLKQEADEAKRKADADAERARQEAAGEFDAVKTSLTSERDAAVSERDALKGEVETLRSYVTADIDATLTDDRYKPFLRFDPGADAPIADRLKWLEDAKASVAELPKVHNPRGSGPQPRPQDGKATTEAENRARALTRPRL